MITITKFFFSCLILASTLTVNAQVNLNFTSNEDIATGWIFSGTDVTNTTVENNEYLAMTRFGTNNWCTAIYQPVGGIAFGTDRFIAVKSSNSSIGVKLSDGTIYLGTSAYSIPVSPVPGSKFYIHVFRVANFTGGSLPSLTGNLTCTKMEFSTQGGTPGVTATDPTVYIDWVKSFSTEAAMLQFALDNEKFDIDFKATDAVNNNLNLWRSNAVTINDAPTLSADNEYMQFTPKVGATLPDTTSVRYNPSLGWDWDMTTAKVVVIRMNCTTRPLIGIWASALVPSGIFDVKKFAPEANPKKVLNSTDSLYVFQLPAGLTAVTGKQTFRNFKISVPNQKAGDVAKVDWIKTFVSLDAANAYVNGLTPINEVISSKIALKVFKSGNSICIEGLTEPGLVEMYTPSGTKVFSKVMSNGIIPSLPVGIYIAKHKNEIIKVIL